VLRESGAEILVSYMPVGSQQATEFYAQACLDTGVSMVNCVPCFVVSDPKWAAKFAAKGIPCVGDDIKAQVGATITHRTLARLFDDRGVQIDCTYQMNSGGNTDFLNMLSRDRLSSKKISKNRSRPEPARRPPRPGQDPRRPQRLRPVPERQQDLLPENRRHRLRRSADEPRVAAERGRFPNSAAVVVDAIRCCKTRPRRRDERPARPVSAWCMKHPPKQMHDREARLALEEFVNDAVAKMRSEKSAVSSAR